MTLRLSALIAPMLAATLPLAASAACLDDGQVAALYASHQARQPAINPAGLTAADGECSRAKFNALLARDMGAPVGYKAGLTNPAVQERFGADAPVWGILYGPMLLANGATVDTAFGARALFEADLLLRVSSDGINRATSPEMVLAAVDQVIPCIEHGARRPGDESG